MKIRFHILLLAALSAGAAPKIAPDAIEMQPTPARVVPSVPTAPVNPAAGFGPSTVLPPLLNREFRAAWISSVGENSWLAQLAGKSTADQKAVLVAMLDRAVQLRLNAVIFQVRPSCDALYASPLEPWSEYLTGTQGRAPQPFYDPLAFAIEEAHRRGLELHAWFNPYRAHHADAKSPIASNHISRTRPDLVRRYGKYLWLDPGERDVQEHSLRVVMDVVKRYDIDAVHFDDYFYPYSEKNSSGQPMDFPDDPSWIKFGANTGLSREDWRRENVNRFIQRVQYSVHAAKPWVKFGISPFGIWRPGHPPQIRGKDAYAELYADARKWIASGWADYFAPQLYWSIENPPQSFPVLLKWWSDQNLQRRHLWPGLDATKVGTDKWKPGEIAEQVYHTRRQINPPGQIFWGMKNLMSNRNALAEKIARETYPTAALVPAVPWLAGTNAPPPSPKVWVNPRAKGVKVDWQPAGMGSVRLWAVQTRHAGNWKTDLFPGGTGACTLSTRPEVVSVTAIDRFGRASAPMVVELKK